MKAYSIVILLWLITLPGWTQVTESFLQFANHTDMELTANLRIEGSSGMVEAGQTVIEPWQNPNHHSIGEYATVIILDIVFDIYINHKRDRWMAKCERLSLSGNKDYSIEIDIAHDEELLFTILYDFNDIPFDLFNPTTYNIKFPDGTMDVESAYSSTVELGNNPHEANREIMIDGVAHKLIYGTFYEDLDPTKDVIFSLSESEPVTFHKEPDPADLEDPTVLNVLAYNMGILMPFGASDKEEEQRAAVAYKGLPRNMDILIFNEFFDPTQSRRILNSLLPYYPYKTSILNSIEIVPGLEMGGGVVIMSKFPILEEGDYSYRFDGDAEVDGLDELANKGVKYAKIDKHGQIIHVFGTHMHYKPTDPPNMSQFVYETISPNRDDIVLLGGDMNASVFSGKYIPMMDTFHAVVPTYLSFTHKEFQRGTSWNQNHYHPSDGDRPSNIDYVLANEDFKVPIVATNESQAYRLNTTDRDFWGIFDLGDHQPVYGRFEFPSIEASESEIQICEGENFNLNVTTSLAEYSVEWYKDDTFLEGEAQLNLDRTNISSSDWGNYRCELVYSFTPDATINNLPTNYGPYQDLGSHEGRLVREFNIGPIPDVCGITTATFNDTYGNITVFPNPANQWLQITTADATDLELKIFNSAGALMHVSGISQDAKINVQEWPSGIYHLEFAG